MYLGCDCVVARGGAELRDADGEILPGSEHEPSGVAVSWSETQFTISHN